MPTKKISTHWKNYAYHQQFADSQVLDAKAWSNDELLAKMLDEMAAGSPGSVRGRRKKRRNLVLNLTQKHVQRRKLLLGSYARGARVEEQGKPDSQAELREDLGRAKSQLTLWELSMFQAIARGETYREISQRIGTSVPAIKSQVSRCRDRMRKCA